MQGQSLTNSNKSETVKNGSQKAFFTDISDSDPNFGNLRKYVNNLQSKIDYAKWKQALVLKYNYMPMKRIAEKVQNDRINYVKKCAQEEAACNKILSGKQITVQLDLFRQFSSKLDERMKQIKIELTQAKLKRQMLTIQAQEKRKRLKEVMKENMELIKDNLHEVGIQTKEDIAILMRSKSTKDRLIPTSITVDSNRTHIQKKSSLTRLRTHSGKVIGINFTHKLYEECLSKLVQSIQSMKTSEDIQSGIYLDVMQKSNRKRYQSQAKFSLKSKISDTLHNKFGSGVIQQAKLQRQKNDFQMQWQTFKELNWKQIMGIVLVKDKHCQKIKHLLKYI